MVLNIRVFDYCARHGIQVASFNESSSYDAVILNLTDGTKKAVRKKDLDT